MAHVTAHLTHTEISCQNITKWAGSGMSFQVTTVTWSSHGSCRLQQGAVAEPPAKRPSGQAAHPQCHPSTCPDLPGLPGYKLLQEFTRYKMFQGGTTAQLTTWPTATSLAPVLLSINAYWCPLAMCNHAACHVVCRRLVKARSARNASRHYSCRILVAHQFATSSTLKQRQGMPTYD